MNGLNINFNIITRFLSIVSQDDSSSKASSQSHDEVDLTLCFEDTAILYSICALFYLLAALEFLCSNHKHVQRTPLGYLHLLKLVSS